MPTSGIALDGSLYGLKFPERAYIRPYPPRCPPLELTPHELNKYLPRYTDSTWYSTNALGLVRDLRPVAYA